MIPQGFQPNLNTEEMNKFITDQQQGAGSIYYESPPKQSGFRLSSVQGRFAGSFDKLMDDSGVSSPVVMFWTLLEHYMVTEGDRPDMTVISDLQVAVPQEQKLKISVWAYLYFKEMGEVPTENMISAVESAFNGYSYAVHGPVDEYAEKKLADVPGLKRNMFVIAYVFSAEKIGDGKSYDTVRDAALAMYYNSANGKVYPNPRDRSDEGERIGDNAGGWLAQKHFVVTRIRSEVVAGFPDTKKDTLHERELSPGADPEEALEGISKQEAEKLDCGGTFKQHNYKILTLFEYPEFMLVWREKRLVLYRDDCGNEISIRIQVPVIQIRFSQLNLWAYMRHPDNTDEVNDVIMKVLETCAIRAALSGAVVGVALLNFSAAVAAFKAVFQRCVDDHLNTVIQCMIPGLSTLTEVKSPGWKDFIAP